MAAPITNDATELDTDKAVARRVTPVKGARHRARKHRRRDLVEVRSQSEILATLDAQGWLAGLPFMPEMAKFCGRRFRVHRRASKVFIDRHYYVARLEGWVLLEGVRCDGASHGACQMACLAFWNDAWLKPVDPADRPHADPTAVRDCQDLPTTQRDRFCCQATELIRATKPLPWWDVRQYVRDLVFGELTIGQFVRMLRLLVSNKLRRIGKLSPVDTVTGWHQKAPTGRLDLQPGDLVEVKSRDEIEATLDEDGRNRGLAISPGMLACCGGRYRVASRVERLVIEWSGQLRRIGSTVALEGVTCDGLAQRGCPRDCYHLWRESWLKRV